MWIGPLKHVPYATEIPLYENPDVTGKTAVSLKYVIALHAGVWTIHIDEATLLPYTCTA
jgi:hypothetical protein